MVDGASNIKGSGIGVYLNSHDGEVIKQSFSLEFSTSNNEAEYEALIARLRLAKALGARRLKIHSNSQLVVNQVLSDYTVKDTRMEAYLNIVRSLVKHFEEYTIQQILRDLNTQADTTLARFGSISEPSLRRNILIDFIKKPSIEIETISTIEEVGEDWRTPIVTYLNEGLLPEDKQEA